MAGVLEDKVVAVTGGGRASAGRSRWRRQRRAPGSSSPTTASAMDGSEPTSDVADEVVAEIEKHGGEAIAVAGDVSTMAGGQAVDRRRRRHVGTHRRRRLRRRHPARADAVQHVRGRVRRRRAGAPQGHVHGVPRRVGGDAQAGGRRQPRRLHVAACGLSARTAQANYAAAKGGIVSLTYAAALGPRALRRAGQLHRAGGPHPDERQRADAARRERRARGRRPDGRLPPVGRRARTSPARCTPSSATRSPCGASRPSSGRCTTTAGGRPS